MLAQFGHTAHCDHRGNQRAGVSRARVWRLANSANRDHWVGRSSVSRSCIRRSSPARGECSTESRAGDNGMHGTRPDLARSELAHLRRSHCVVVPLASQRTKLAAKHKISPEIDAYLRRSRK